MDSTRSHVPMTELSPGGAQPRMAQKHADPIEGPRLLGAKRAALRERRRRTAAGRSHVGLAGSADGTAGKLLSSKDGSVAFLMRGGSSSLIVEKRNCPMSGQRTAQTVAFESACAFDRWCDGEPIRFHDPQLHEQLRAQGHELLGEHG